MANTKEIKTLIQEIFMFGDGSFDQFSTEELLTLLRAADDAYTNEQPILEDSQYDALYRYVEMTDPDNTYFLSVGSEVRTGKEKLPFQMGSLDQIYEGGISKWVGDNSLENDNMIITEKLDGYSCLLVFDDKGNLQNAFSRGDGYMGASIYRHMKHVVKSNPNNAYRIVRGEVIFNKFDWPQIRAQIKNRGGRLYKNPRNCISGLMNSSQIDVLTYQWINFIAYDVVNTNLSKAAQLGELSDGGFAIPNYRTLKGKMLNDKILTDILTDMKATSKFELDGIVIDVDGSSKRNHLDPKRTTLNPKFAVKYKVADATNMAIAKVIEVQWNLSKNGYLKPRVKIEPTELDGVTVQHATGFNAKFIYDNRIGEGARIRIIRSGQVIPFIVGVVEPSEKNGDRFDETFNEILAEQFGEGSWEWSEKGVDAILINAADNDTVKLEQLIDFFSKVGTEYLGEGNLKTVFDAGFTTVVDVINLSQFELTSMIGANGKKIYASIREKLKNVPWYIVAGSVSTFGRGIGRKKMKKLYDAFKGDMTKLSRVDAILAVDGFELKTATKITSGYTNFLKFLTDTSATITFAKYEAPKSGSLSGQSFLFTNFRDKDLEKRIESKGGKMSSSVSSKLTYLVAADPNGNTGKLTKARELGIKIISREQLEEML